MTDIRLDVAFVKKQTNLITSEISIDEYEQAIYRSLGYGRDI